MEKPAPSNMGGAGRGGGMDFPAPFSRTLIITPARGTPRGYKWSSAQGISVMHALRTPPRSIPRHALRAGDTSSSRAQSHEDAGSTQRRGPHLAPVPFGTGSRALDTLRAGDDPRLVQARERFAPPEMSKVGSAILGRENVILSAGRTGRAKCRHRVAAGPALLCVRAGERSAPPDTLKRGFCHSRPGERHTRPRETERTKGWHVVAARPRSFACWPAAREVCGA